MINKGSDPEMERPGIESQDHTLDELIQEYLCEEGIEAGPGSKSAGIESQDHSLDEIILEYLCEKGISQGLLESLKAELEAKQLKDSQHQTTSSSDCRLLRIFKYAMYGQLKITTSLLSGESRSFEVHAWTTVGDVQSLIAKDMKIPEFAQRLIHGSHPLRSKQESLASCKVTPVDATLSVVCVQTQQALSGSANGILKIWDLLEGECIHTIEAHDAPIWAIAADIQQMRALTCSGDHTLKLWNLETGQCLRSYAGHADTVRSIAVDWGQFIALTGSLDCTIKLWDLSGALDSTPGRENSRCTDTMYGHENAVNCVAMDWSVKRAVSGSSDNTVMLWNLANRTCIWSRQEHLDAIFTLSMSWSIQFALSGSQDSTLKLWDLDKGSCSLTYRGHRSAVSAVDVHWASMRAVSGSADFTLRIWDLAGSSCLRTLEGHGDLVWAVAVDWSSMTAVSTSVDESVRLWNLGTGESTVEMVGHHDAVLSVWMSCQ